MFELSITRDLVSFEAQSAVKGHLLSSELLGLEQIQHLLQLPLFMTACKSIERTEPAVGEVGRYSSP